MNRTLRNYLILFWFFILLILIYLYFFQPEIFYRMFQYPGSGSPYVNTPSGED